MSNTVVVQTIDEGSRGPLRDAGLLLASLRESEPGARSTAFEEVERCFRAFAAEAESLQSQTAVLLQQQAALKTVISSVPFFVFWKDSDCVYRGCNDIFASLGGLKSPEDIVGKTDYDMPWTKEQSDLYREDDLRVIRSGEPKLNIEETNLDADGNEKVILTSKVPLQAKDGSVIGMLGIFADITARKQMEKDLSRAKELAEAANRAKSDFLAAVGHELRTPLALVLGPLDSLLARTDLPGEAALELERVRRNALRLKSLMDDVLDFSKADAGKTEAHEDVFDPEDLVRSLVDDVRAAATTRRLEIGADTQPIGLVTLDRRMFEKILLNLIGNALKFTPAGGKIAVSLRADRDSIELAVQDNGIGIARHDLDRLFKRFQQIDSSSTRRYEGTGLGLSLIKQFAELMGGIVGVESEPGRGSRFFVKLPRKACLNPELLGAGGDQRQTDLATLNARFAELSTAPPALTPPTDANPERPLIVLAEDNVDLRTYLVGLLEKEYRVVACSDGRAALAAATQHQPAVIVSDIMMPEMDGRELLFRLKSDSALHEIPVILLTALASQNALAISLASGAADFLNKPFRPSELLARVGVAARLSAARRQLSGRNEELLKAHTQLAQRNAAMRLVLDNVDQGLVTLDAKGRVSDERSAMVDRWFGSYTRPPLFTELLSADPSFADAFQVGFESLTEGLLPRELCLEQLPKRLAAGARTFECRYLPVDGTGTEPGILAIIDDITEQQRIDAETAERRELLAVYTALMHHREDFLTFFDDSSLGLQRLVRDRATDAPSRLFIHSLKGDSAMMGFELTASLCHQVEEELAAGRAPASLGKLTQLWSALGETVRAVVGDRSLLGIEVPRDELQTLAAEIAQGASGDRLLRRLDSWRLEPAAKAFARLGAYARRVAGQLRKAELTVDVETHALLVDPKHWTPIWSSLVHLIRNAVDHGIETPDARQQAGKPRGGRLRLTTSVTDDHIVIEIGDDGRGIDWPKIRQLAVEKGLSAKDDADLLGAVLHSGLSTRDQVSTTSGRGVGLAAVAAAIRELGGTIAVESQLGRGTVWRISVPRTSERLASN